MLKNGNEIMTTQSQQGGKDCHYHEGIGKVQILVFLYIFCVVYISIVNLMYGYFTRTRILIKSHLYLSHNYVHTLLCQYYFFPCLISYLS